MPLHITLHAATYHFTYSTLQLSKNHLLVWLSHAFFETPKTPTNLLSQFAEIPHIPQTFVKFGNIHVYLSQSKPTPAPRHPSHWRPKHRPSELKDIASQRRFGLCLFQSTSSPQLQVHNFFLKILEHRKRLHAVCLKLQKWPSVFFLTLGPRKLFKASRSESNTLDRPSRAISWQAPYLPCRPLSGWWFQPIWKICSSNWILSPSRGENKTCLKPPPTYTLHFWCIFVSQIKEKSLESHIQARLNEECELFFWIGSWKKNSF